MLSCIVWSSRRRTPDTGAGIVRLAGGAAAAEGFARPFDGIRAGAAVGGAATFPSMVAMTDEMRAPRVRDEVFAAIFSCERAGATFNTMKLAHDRVDAHQQFPCALALHNGTACW